MSKPIIDQINKISERILDLQEVKDLPVNENEKAEKDRAILRTRDYLIKQIRNLNYFISQGQGQGQKYENEYKEINTALPDDIPKIISPQSIINEKYSNLKAEEERHIIISCDAANNQPETLQNAFDLFKIKITMDNFFNMSNAEELLIVYYKKLTKTCVDNNYDNVLQEKYKNNIDEARNIIQNEINTRRHLKLKAARLEATRLEEADQLARQEAARQEADIANKKVIKDLSEKQSHTANLLQKEAAEEDQKAAIAANQKALETQKKRVAAEAAAAEATVAKNQSYEDIKTRAKKIINNNCSNALSWPNNLQEALTILGLGTSEAFFNLPNITKSLNDAYDKKNLQCVNHEVQGLDIQSYDEYKRNIAEAKAIIEQHIIRYNSKKCADANDQPKDVEQALFILGLGTIDELLRQSNANASLDDAYKNKTDACAKYVGFDKVSQNKYKYNIDQAYHIIKEQIETERRPETPEQIETKKTKLARDNAINLAKGLTSQRNSRLEENKKMAEKYAAETRDIRLNTEAEANLKKEKKQLQDLQDLPKDLDNLSTLLAKSKQSPISAASVETTQTGNVIYPIISDDAGSNSSRPRSDTASSMSSLTNSATSSRANSFSSQDQEQELTKEEFNQAIVAIKHLFALKTSEDQKMPNVEIKKNILKKKIEENTTQKAETNTATMTILKNAFSFYREASPFINKTAGTIIHPLTYIVDLNKYEHDKNDHAQRKKNIQGILSTLKKFYDGFYEQYKTLGFSNSNIYLNPTPNNNIGTRKNYSGILCDKISQLIQPMYSNRTIPSQIPNLTKRNITKKVTKDETKRVNEAKTREEANKEKENTRKELNTSLEKVKKDTNTKETAAIQNEIKKLTTTLSAGDLNLKAIEKIKQKIAKLEGMLKSGVKGGTRKRILISNRKKNFKVTRKR